MGVDKSRCNDMATGVNYSFSFDVGFGDNCDTVVDNPDIALAIKASLRVHNTSVDDGNIELLRRRGSIKRAVGKGRGADLREHDWCKGQSRCGNHQTRDRKKPQMVPLFHLGSSF